MKKTRKLAIGLALSVLITGIAACSSDTPATTPKPADTTAGETEAGETEKETTEAEANDSSESASGEKTVIVVSQYPTTDEIIEQRGTYLEDPLAEEFPEYEMRFEIVADRQSLQVQVAGGGGPDILDLDGPTDAVEYAKAGRIVPLDDYAAEYGWEELFFEWAWGTSLYNETLYSLPNSFEGMLLYINNTVFEEQGLSIPETDEELIDTMIKLQEAGIIPLSFGNAGYQGAVDWLYSTFLSCYAGPTELKAALMGELGWTEEPILGSINMMVDWWKEGYIGERASQTIAVTDVVPFFSDGRAGMMINGTWAATELLNDYPDTEWTTVLMPELRDGVGQILPLATGGAFAINANSSKQDESAEVLNYLFSSTERHMSSVREASFQPYPIQSFSIEQLEGMDERSVDMYDKLIQAQQDEMVGFCAWTFFPSDSRVYMNENTDALFLDMLSVEDYLTEVQGFIDGALADGSAPVLP